MNSIQGTQNMKSESVKAPALNRVLAPLSDPAAPRIGRLHANSIKITTELHVLSREFRFGPGADTPYITLSRDLRELLETSRSRTTKRKH